MTHHRWHFLEKVQVEVAAAVGLLLMYYVAWPLVRPWDPDAAVTFVPQLALGRLGLFALCLWGVAAICTLLTVSARPAGSLLATLIAAGGISLRSDSIRTLLMRYQDAFGKLYAPLIGELLLMGVVLVGAAAVVLLVRRAVRQVCPRWVRQEVPLPPPEAPAAKGRKAPAAAKEPTRADALISYAASCAVTVAGAYVLLLVTLFSGDRGQILFALAISFFGASLLSRYLFVTPNALSQCVAVLLLATVFYLKACLVPAGELAWTRIIPSAQALPVDWLAAGCGGALGGYWWASRLHDVQRLGKAKTSDSDE